MLYLIKSRRLKCKAITKGLKINKENYTPNSKVALNLKLIKIYMPNTTTYVVVEYCFFSYKISYKHISNINHSYHGDRVRALIKRNRTAYQDTF